jgi:hypothetical protein
VFKSISEPHSTHKGNVEILKKTFLKTWEGSEDEFYYRHRIRSCSRDWEQDPAARASNPSQFSYMAYFTALSLSRIYSAEW